MNSMFCTVNRLNRLAPLKAFLIEVGLCFESFWPQDEGLKSSSEEFRRNFRGNSETGTFWFPKTGKSKSSGYCLM